MDRTKALLNPNMARLIRKSFPVVRKRSALWFFNNEFKKNLMETSPTPNAVLNSPPIQKEAASKTKVSRNRILQMWRNMDPESKRKYFNMAAFDEVRYKDQKSLWVSEVGALLHKFRDLDRVMSLAPTHEELQGEFLESLDKLQKNYEQMIQIESTKEIYKDAIKRADSDSMGADEIISALPKHHEAVLTKPRRPPAAFVLYLNNNMHRYLEIRRKTKTKENCMRLCANEWSNLDTKTRQIYEDRYQRLKLDYDKAMEQYKSETQGVSDIYIQEASREKKAFRRSLRKRLRDSHVLPLSIRNAFNFFMMENKDNKLIDATETWRNLPPEKKMKYNKMNEEDVRRYNREMESFGEIKRSLCELISNRNDSRLGRRKLD